MTSATANPPQFSTTNPDIELVAGRDGKVTGVSVYPPRAEVTRLFKFVIKTGQNRVSISGLPNVIDHPSLRVQGHGAATIHDVSLSHDLPPGAKTKKTSPKLEELETELDKVTTSLRRARDAIRFLETYISDLRYNSNKEVKYPLVDVVEDYTTAAGKLDAQVLQLTAKRTELHTKIANEEESLSEPLQNERLGMKVSIVVFGHTAGEVEISLTYAVRNATWRPTYDIRVDLQTKDKPVTLVYKGSIIQNTGEDWTDAPIKLETVAPAFDIAISSLQKWTLSLEDPVQAQKRRQELEREYATRHWTNYHYSAPQIQSAPIVIPSPRGRSRSPSSRSPRRYERYSGRRSRCSSSSRSRSRARMSSVAMRAAPEPEVITHRNLDVGTGGKGDISATFVVPGLMTVPSDNVAHIVTIAELGLDAEMEWVSVPKRDIRVYLKAKVKNASEYTLLKGPVSVYVDGSFLARTNIPDVNPDETFDCPLGVDHSVRITYAPLSKQQSDSGLITKSRVHTFTRRINIQNTKSSKPVANLIIHDHIPVSENALIGVKLISPALQLPAPENSGSNYSNAGSLASSTLKQFVTVQGGDGMTVNKFGIKIPAPVKVTKDVVAQWQGADEAETQADVQALGSDGKLVWKCAVPAQGKVALSLQWEVSAPVKSNIVGL
ncbi:hypothetical protein CC1G_15048 [Coprinopsis cinerea okayama7|uniref:Mucoidy inhibitor A n=1 Tax=Coprinopsis cinerea (strain Okayama-7 / 130 / ATCC MYA-4618 / FGSC 9003) TaxID=240176 RepID=D6RP33_COPC7|nr:hypothetical protein CC1G_15048 [Coprinopsis cinerea okayama7\|eukprot:XP_002910714.1 hypothetical protein CC1G_15048 [Coprinopsis cinerea okayama7\